ncbi:hypothetical protein PO883_29600 [Massilia sp. DJPM01]|uniref:hypothetical protein n=1 Tax=Massilia sp. DJPM01 TaxID=3024404 RepID=UPI00259F2BAE|nr:hypothetical protein [Massilia sp. DJPM01]MDM5181341.1 hypothetical protein [Massilia sp. DJPM01]
MKYVISLVLAVAMAASAFASPGAHGPNGEHLDGPAGTASTGTAPRVETFSEAFELVGQLSGGELSVMIDRYETNEPVLNGQLEVEYKGVKAAAKFHPDMGDYAIDDEKFLKALATPGKHALLFTFIAGEESDLLEGTLEVTAPAAAVHQHTSAWKWLALGGALALSITVLMWLRRNKKNKVTI